MGEIIMQKGVKMSGSFTLIELLIVISIIATLAGILLPALLRAKENAVQINCANNVKSLGQAANFYVSDFNDYLPATCNGQFVIELASYLNVRREAILKTKMQGLFLCKNTSPYEAEPTVPMLTSYWPTLTYTDISEATKNIYGGWSKSANQRYEPKRISAVTSGSVLLIERYLTFKDTGVLGSNAIPMPSSTKASYIYSENKAYRMDFRHIKKSNVLFLDGSVKGIRYGVLFDADWRL